MSYSNRWSVAVLRNFVNRPVEGFRGATMSWDRRRLCD
jgi:hypothetical protein